MSNIPEARSRLTTLRDEMDALDDEDLIVELDVIISLLNRKPAIDKTPPRSRPMTPELAEEIRLFKRNNTRWSQVEIGNYFKVNPGRVSEALNARSV